MTCFVPALDTLTYPYVVSPLLVVGQVLHAFSPRAWLVLVCQLHLDGPRQIFLNSYWIDHVIWILWPVLHTHSYWPCFSGVASFPETVEAPANVNQVRMYSVESLLYLLLTWMILRVWRSLYNSFRHCFWNIFAQNFKGELHWFYTLSSVYWKMVVLWQKPKI